MPQPVSGFAAQTSAAYLLFAHEPYHPGPGTQEINTTVVVADSLLHPQVRQPDGARIHDLLAQGRRPGEIIPLATLTHELNGGDDWPSVGDWERVTTDLLHLVRCGDCDALSLGLPAIPRALVCSGPHSHVRVYDVTADDFIDYGPAERAIVVTEISRLLSCLVTERSFWPGDGLLPRRADAHELDRAISRGLGQLGHTVGRPTTNKDFPVRSHAGDVDTEDDELAWIERQIGPRQVGGRYYSGSRDQEYEVLTIDDEPDSWGQWGITVRWADDHESTHCAAWDPERDRVIAHPPADDTQVG